jgi:hypothetical protein
MNNIENPKKNSNMKINHLIFLHESVYFVIKKLKILFYLLNPIFVKIPIQKKNGQTLKNRRKI